MKLIIIALALATASASKATLTLRNLSGSAVQIAWDGHTLTIPQHTQKLADADSKVDKLRTEFDTLVGTVDTLIGTVGQLRTEFDAYTTAEASEARHGINIEALQQQVNELSMDVTKTPLNHHAFTCSFGTVDQDARKCTCAANKYGGGTYVSGTAYPVCHTCSNINCSNNYYQSGKCSTDDGNNFQCNACSNQSCGTNKYQTGSCGGRTNGFQCASCDNTICAAGKYQSGACGGNGANKRNNNFQCDDCDNKTCGPGKYRTGSCSGRNNGFECVECDNKTCGAGKYRSGSCSGTSNGYTCNSCDNISCPAGHTRTGSCSGTNNGYTCTPPAWGFEVGTVTSDSTVNDGWQSVSFANTYTNPVVIVGPPTYAGSNEIVVSVKDVTSTGFKWFFSETPCRDNNHVSETFAWMVAESGRHYINGQDLYFGKHTQTNPVGEWETVTHNHGVGSRPVVLATIQNAGRSGGLTGNNAYFVSVRTQSAGTNSFQVYAQGINKRTGPNAGGLEEDNLARGDEVYGYVVMAQDTSGTTSDGTKKFDAYVSGDTVSHEDSTLTFGVTMANNQYAAFGSVYTFEGGDPANLRLKSKTSETMTVFIDEDTCQDTDEDHTTERVALFAATKGVYESGVPA